MAAQIVKAEVAGKVWKLIAQPGQELAQDDPILIVESMKMEIPVVAPARGTLSEILVAEGDVITEGQNLAVIKS